MARNRNREFSEGSSLNPMDLGDYAKETEARRPLWDRQDVGDMSSWRRPGSQAGTEETRADASLPEAPEDRPEAPAPDEPLAAEAMPDAETAPAEENAEELAGNPQEAPLSADDETPDEKEPRERIVQTRAEKQRWDDEAHEPQKVESSAGKWRSASAAEKRTPDPAAGESSKKEKKTGKKPGKKTTKKGKQSKKKKTQEEERQSFIRLMMIILLCGGLFLMAAVMVVSNFVNLPILSVPQKIVTSVVSPIQSFFSTITTSVADYMRMLKIRGNIEYEYEQLRILVDDYATQVAQMDDLRVKYEALLEQVNEQSANVALNPLPAQVIGKVGNNYFSTLTLNKGSEDGVADYMAVVHAGGLVGVTYNVKAHQCDVRCIIDSDCTVAGVVSSSRDQGSVKGTLGTNGEPMCRMYYLPDNSLPRPGDTVLTSGVGLEFPRGIPIGTIRESTRGMEDNKSYVVVEPVVDFQHLEQVTVYRYRPPYAESAQQRVSSSQNIRLEPLVTERPTPSFNLDGQSDFIYSSTLAPSASVTRPPVGSASDSPAPVMRTTPDPNATALPPSLEYVVPNAVGETPEPTPRPTFTPTPTPVPTSDPGAMTVEEDE